MKTLDGNNIYSEIDKMVQGAEKSIKIASAWLKGSLVGRLLKNNETPNIEIILRASELKDLLITDENVFKVVKERGGKVFLNNRLHAKFIIVDDEKAVLGSANFTEAGMSNYSKGNIEAAVHYDQSDAGEVQKLTNYFDKIKKDSISFSDDLVGFALNPVKSSSFEFILLDPDVTEQSYVEVNVKGNKTLIGKIESIYSYDMGFFANPFSGSESQVFGSLDEFKLLFSEGKDNNWRKAAIYSYLNEKESKTRIAVAKVVGEVDDGKLQTILKPFDVGTGVYRASKDTLDKVMKNNFSGKEMQKPLKVGHLEGNKEIEVFVDLDEIITKHMAILGTTGSGKSYFTKLFIKRAAESENPPKIFILDPHGEYYQGLMDFRVPKNLIKEVKIPDTIFPICYEDVENLIKDLGYGYLISGNSKTVKENKNKILKSVKPSLKNVRNLKEVLDGLKLSEDKKQQKDGNQQKTTKDKNSNENLAPDPPREDQQRISEDSYAKKVLSSKWENQEKVSQMLGEILHLNSKNEDNGNALIRILNLREVTDPKTRVNIAGLLMQELFHTSRNDKKRRLLILEEAHNFAPETGYGDVSAGRDNLALRMARKIAAEGRKFNLGLVVITQRPSQVSKYILAQTNTQAMFRIININDLQAVETFTEFAGRDTTSLLPTLQTGTGVISGLAVPFPVLTRVE